METNCIKKRMVIVVAVFAISCAFVLGACSTHLNGRYTCEEADSFSLQTLEFDGDEVAISDGYGVVGIVPYEINGEKITIKGGNIAYNFNDIGTISDDRKTINIYGNEYVKG